MEMRISKMDRMTVEQELEYLRSRSRFLSCLEMSGVDNWSGYSAAMEMFDEESEELEDED